MADQITFKEMIGDDIFARAVFAALCEDQPIFQKLEMSQGTPKDRSFTIECKINGIEISLKGYLKRLEEQMDRNVHNRARELLTAYLRDTGANDRIDTMSSILEKFEKQLIADFFPNDLDFQ